MGCGIGRDWYDSVKAATTTEPTATTEPTVRSKLRKTKRELESVVEHVEKGSYDDNTVDGWLADILTTQAKIGAALIESQLEIIRLLKR